MKEETGVSPHPAVPSSSRAGGGSGNGAKSPDGNGKISTSEEMLSLLVHELRNPLAVVKGFAETIESSAEQLDRQALINSARAMQKAAGHLEELVESLGDVRTLFGDDVKLTLEQTSLTELINTTVDDLAVVGGKHSVEVSIEDDIRLDIDPVRIRQVLTNLIANAYKFAPEDEPIGLSLRRDGDRAEVCVTDHGPGIPPGREEEVFRKYTRLDTDVQGSGLGLYISRAIARAHGGDLTVTSDIGSCRFILELPLRQRPRVIRLDES